jgi:hypothetical protein
MAKDVIAPKVEHRADAKYGEFAVRDKVQGDAAAKVSGGYERGSSTDCGGSSTGVWAGC